jgi:hypothetical protein
MARRVTVDDWVRVFKRKRSEIAAARCNTWIRAPDLPAGNQKV